MEKIPVTVKYEEGILKQIDRLATENFETRSEFIRDITTSAVKRKLQMKKLENLAISKWIKGSLNTDELTMVLGREEADRIVLLRKTLRQSVLDGMKLGKELRK